MSVPATTPAPSSPADRLPLGLTVDRRFTTAGADPFESFTFVEREALVRDFKTGEVKFQLTIEVPDDWDQGAVDVVASKYARKAGVPQLDDTGAPLENSDGSPVLGPERSAKQIVGRMARAWRIWGERGGYFATSDDAQAFEDEMAYMIMNQMGAPNSPQWFNTGLYEVHGIVEDPEGNWYYDPETDQVVQSAHKYERTAASACYIMAVEDNLAGPDGIMALATNEARLFKAGSGSGANLGKIREKGAGLTGGGQSSGVMGFARAIDRSAGAIKSGGTTRRAAKMVILDADHPDIDEFVWCKVAEEKIARDLISLGYDSGYDTPGGAYDIVSFQNANHSVRIPRGFKALLDSNGDLELRSRRDGTVVGTVPAEKLWADIAEAAWFSADPGVQFDGIINDWATTPADGRIRGSNPCFTADTLVHTTKGLIAFGELMERATAGEEFGVYTHDATAGEGATDIVATTPDAFMVTGHNEIVRVEFANGMRVRCTPNHRFWTANRGWVRADELTENDDVQLADAEHLPVDASWDIPVSADPADHHTKGDHGHPVHLPSEWTEDLGHWLGWLVGDGSVNGTVVSSIYGSAEDRDEILPQHLPVVTALNGGREPKLFHQDNGTVQARLSRRTIRRWLEELGVAKVTGPSKRVPWSMFQAPAEVAAAFLSGLFDADGSVHNVEGSRRWVQLGSTSWELLVDVQRLLTVFGVQSTLYRGKDRSDEPVSGDTTVGGEQRRYTQRNPNHQLRITGQSMKAFHRHIGFRLTRKQAVLDEIMLTEQYRSRSTTKLASRVDDGVELTFNLAEPRNHSYMVNGLVVSNCSEYLHVDDTSCNLASINLGKFFDADRQRFDVAGYEHAARLWTIALEITVAMSHYPTESVARKSYDHRTIGLGFANLGALVMRAGLPYDSREARAVMGAVTALMHARSYATSAEMAAAVGPAAAYERNAEAMQRVLRNHRRAAYGSERDAAGLGDYEDLEVLPVEIDHRTLARTPFGELTDAVKAAADDMVDSVARHGARNTQTTVVAPTGTISLAMSCDTSGPEPDFALVKWKKLAGGGYMKIVNQSVPAALRALGYSEPQVDRIVTYALGTQTLNSNTPVSRDALAEAGVPAEVLDKVEAELPTSGNLAMAFAPHVVGRDIFTAHGLDPDVDAASMLLTALGFSAEQIVESSKTICGHETVEGAPDLRDEDLPVFDTANYCGDGTRFIAWEGHVRALGAIQPHVSGGISKTINMPHEATVDDIRRAHEMAYELGVKCVAVYRDGSKASQPLSRSITDADAADANDDDAASQLPLHAEIAPGMSPVEYYQGKVPPRFRLPKNRAARTFSFEVGGMDCYLTTGEYDDGTLGEIWVNVGKDGSTMHGAFSAFSIAVSLGLQRGVPLEHFVEKYKGRNFSPNGVVNHPNLKMASSIPDAIFRILGWWYGGRDDLVQVPEAGAPRPGAATAAVLTPVVTTPVAPAAPVVAEAPPVAPGTEGSVELANPYTGNLCPECSSPEMVKNGACERCVSCGTTTGCS